LDGDRTRVESLAVFVTKIVRAVPELVVAVVTAALDRSAREEGAVR